jgi:hypothetical protein
MSWAGALFFGVASGLLAFGLTRRADDGPWPLLAFATPAYLIAARLGQWTPLLTAAMLWPALAPLACLKPSLGVPIVAARPSRWAVMGAALLCAAALLVRPKWPMEWLGVLQGDPIHFAPIKLLGGPVLALAVLRWRRAEARLLLALACVPQIFLFADQLLLIVVPATRRERLAQAVLMWIGWALAARATGPGEMVMLVAPPYVLAFVYLPALVMVLRRPNEGGVGEWLERVLVRSRVPRWIAGGRAVFR